MGDDAVRQYLHKDEPRGLWGTLWLCVNPFTRLDGWTALGLGLLVVAGTAVVAVFGRVHFDGVMDLHVGAGARPWFFAFEALADWLIVALIFWAAAAIFSRSKPRALDFFGMLGIGRLPFLIAGAVWIRPILGGLMDGLTRALALGLAQPGQIMQQLATVPGIGWIVVGACVTMVIMLWGLFLNFFAVREASGMATGPAVGLFAGGAIVAEILSKIAIILALSAAKPL
jgi:hypothetical protein